MRPSDLPELRERMLARMADLEQVVANADRVLAEASGHEGRDVPPLMLRQYAELARKQKLTAEQLREASFGPRMMASHWRMADLFFVTDEMAGVACQAAETMPEFELHADDLPAPSGVMYFDFDRLQATDPAGEKPLDIFNLTVVWGPDHAPGPDRMDVVLTLQADVRPNASDPCVLHQVRMGYGTGRLWVSSDNAGPWPSIVRCAWLLMQQRVAAVDVVRPDRASSRRILRRGGRVDPVRVIRLRYAGGPERGDGEAARAYAHRWVVKGHWRKQWYPSQGRHIPIWISPFMKGPDGAPILGGEKVYAWTR